MDYLVVKFRSYNSKHRLTVMNKFWHPSSGGVSGLNRHAGNDKRYMVDIERAPIIFVR
jgi:hypothetical protein